MSFFDEVANRMDRDLESESESPGVNGDKKPSEILSTCCASCDSTIPGIHRGDCPALEEVHL